MLQKCYACFFRLHAVVFIFDRNLDQGGVIEFTTKPASRGESCGRLGSSSDLFYFSGDGNHSTTALVTVNLELHDAYYFCLSQAENEAAGRAELSFVHQVSDRY